MARYHVNPATGNPGRCRAEKACPFGLPREEHHGSPQEAREAYERLERASATPAPARRLDPYSTQRRAVEDLYAEVKSLTSDGHLRKALEEAEAGLATCSTKLDLLRFEALEAAESRRLYREGSWREACAKRVAMEMAEPLLDALRFDSNLSHHHRELVAYYKLHHGDALRVADSRLSQEIATAPEGARWPRGEEAIPIAYADGGEATVASTLLDPSGRQFAPREDGSTAHGQAVAEAARGADHLANLLTQQGEVTPASSTFPVGFQEGAPGRGAYGLRQREDPAFELLGSGIDFNAYLHRSTGLVYKVANASNGEIVNAGPKTREEELSLHRRHLAELQRTYAAVDDEQLARRGVEYCPTLFLTGSNHRGEEHFFMAQPYLSTAEWAPVDLSSLSNSLRSAGVVDLHDGNVRVEKATGRVVIFDGLPLE